ncbi:MAG: hypothetical protein WDO72_07580 [Pseudomonadota bacterium]
MHIGELLNMPQPAFETYIFRLSEFLLSEDSAGDADTASAFLHVLCTRERSHPGSVARIYERLLPAIGFVAASQPRFGAHKDLYGDFGERAAELARLFHRNPDELTGESQMLDASDDA